MGKIKKNKYKNEGMKKRWGEGTPSSPYKRRGEQTGMSLNVSDLFDPFECRRVASSFETLSGVAPQVFIQKPW